MLRWVIGLLVLANAGYFAWTQGYLAPLGLVLHEEREPHRLQSQMRPDVFRLLNASRPQNPPLPASSPANPNPSTQAGTPPAESAAQTTAAPTPTLSQATQPAASESPSTVAQPQTATPAATAPALAEVRSCWQVGGFTEQQEPNLRTALTALDLPRGTWQLSENRNGGRWIVYMGRYDNAAQVERKKTELRELKVAFRDVSAPGLSPGLALGTYSSEAAAEQALQNVVRSGVRTARVAQERAESTSFSLRLPNATADQRNAVAGLGAVLANKSLRPCN